MLFPIAINRLDFLNEVGPVLCCALRSRVGRGEVVPEEGLGQEYFLGQSPRKFHEALHLIF